MGEICVYWSANDGYGFTVPAYCSIGLLHHPFQGVSGAAGGGSVCPALIPTPAGKSVSVAQPMRSLGWREKWTIQPALRWLSLERQPVSDCCLSSRRDYALHGGKRPASFTGCKSVSASTWKALRAEHGTRRLNASRGCDIHSVHSYSKWSGLRKLFLNMPRTEDLHACVTSPDM